MAKLTIFAALFVALIAGASAYTTVVTTSVVDEEENQQSCQMEVRQMRMRHCMQWMQMGTGPYEASFVRSEMANQQFGEEHLQQCCNELRRFSPQCRCEAIRHMMRQTAQEYGMEEQMMRQRAQSLSRMCNMRSPTQCQLMAVFV